MWCNPDYLRGGGRGSIEEKVRRKGSGVSVTRNPVTYEGHVNT